MSNSLTRRHLMTQLTGTSLAVGLTQLPIAKRAHAEEDNIDLNTTSLKSLGAKVGIRIGTAISTQGLRDKAYCDMITQHCDLLVAENEFKSYVISPQPGLMNFDPAQEIVDFARRNSMAIRGHTLIWNKDDVIPKWLQSYDFGEDPYSGCANYIRNYIRQVCTRFPNQIFSWDVINETVDPETGLLRKTPFTARMGLQALTYAYECAREYAPQAELVYNDYMGWSPYSMKHRLGVLKLLEAFRKNNTPIDTLGVQSHIGTDTDRHEFRQKEWKAFLDEVVQMGYRLIITEFDFNDKALLKNLNERDKISSGLTQDYLDMMFSYPQLDQFLFWGMADHHSWIRQPNKNPIESKMRPTPFDPNLKPNPILMAVANALKNAPLRTPNPIKLRP